MYTYSFYDNDTERLIDFCVKYDYQLSIGDNVILKGIKYKIVGSKFNTGETDEKRKTFYVDSISA